MLLNMLGVASDDVVELTSRGVGRDTEVRVTMTGLVEVLLASFASANPEPAPSAVDEGPAEPSAGITQMSEPAADPGARRDAA